MLCKAWLQHLASSWPAQRIALPRPARRASRRHSGRLQLHPKYNCWEMAAPEGDRVDMNHEGGINRAEGEARRLRCRLGGCAAALWWRQGRAGVCLTASRCLHGWSENCSCTGVSCPLLLLCSRAANYLPACHPRCVAPFGPAGVDYYRTQLVVPQDAYELNFVFSNGDGAYDNNGNQVGVRGHGWAQWSMGCACTGGSPRGPA